ncbi:MAG TPA: hypothetical protein VMB21_04575 [Candidatus Limnocylindria bacterium]|jgi:hypothetical protein|nr:hypothetical protein [Candidatus Limnocylindria bacterium]
MKASFKYLAAMVPAFITGWFLSSKESGWNATTTVDRHELATSAVSASGFSGGVEITSPGPASGWCDVGKFLDISNLLRELSAFGLPRKYVEDVIIAECNRLYFNGDSGESRGSLSKQRESAIESALGSSGGQADLMIGSPYVPDADLLRAIGPARRLWIYTMSHVRDQKIQAIKDQANGFPTAGDLAAVSAVEDEYWSTLSTMITDSELRSLKIASMQASPEFSGMYSRLNLDPRELSLAFDYLMAVKSARASGNDSNGEEELASRLRSGLGDVRYNEFMGMSDPVYSEVTALQRRFGLPADLVDQVIGLRNEALMGLVRVDMSKVDPAQMNEFYAQRHVYYRDKLKVLLGDQAYEAYMGSGANVSWVP